MLLYLESYKINNQEMVGGEGILNGDPHGIPVKKKKIKVNKSRVLDYVRTHIL